MMLRNTSGIHPTYTNAAVIKSSADVCQNMNKKLFSVIVITPSMVDIIVVRGLPLKCCNPDSSGQPCLEMPIHGPKAVKGARNSEV